MSKADLLQQALNSTAGKASPERKAVPITSVEVAGPPSPRKAAAGREGKEHIGAWLNSDFGASLRIVQLSKRKNARGTKVYLADLIAEALNDLFLKYDAPTVHHE